MHNRIGYNRLGRKPGHRKALTRNMVISLIKHERIKTTHAKAREVRRKAEKLVTRAKFDSVHNRRLVSRTIHDKEVLDKLFQDVGPRFSQRPGGYTRILKLSGYRRGDAAPMVILEFLGKDEDFSPKNKSDNASISSSNNTIPGNTEQKIPESSTDTTNLSENNTEDTQSDDSEDTNNDKTSLKSDTSSDVNSK